MNEVIVRDDVSSGAALVLNIANREPVSLGTLAQVFDALSRDYQQASSRDLVVKELHRGSIIAVFSDLSDLGDHANHLFDFCKNLGTLATMTIAGAVLLTSKRRLGSKTILAIANAAIKGTADVDLTYKSSNGNEQMMMRITPATGVVLQHGSAASSRETATPQQSRRRKAGIREDIIEEMAKSVSVTEEGFADKRLSQSSDGSSEGIAVLLNELIATIKLRPDGRETLARMSRHLQQSGHHAAAKLLEP